MSISLSFISYPPTAAIPASISSSNDSGSIICNSERTFGRSALHLAPRAFLLGTISIFWKVSKSSMTLISSTLSSSERISWKLERSGPPTIHPDLHGSLCLLPASTLTLLPASAIDLTNSISISTKGSTGGRVLSIISEPTGQSAK